MADEADTKAAVPTSGPVATSTPSDSVATERTQVQENADKAEERHGQVDVRQVEDVARESGDPYFGEYEEDEDDPRASKGTREPRPVDPGTAKLLGVDK